MLNVFKERKAFLNIVLVLDNFEQIQPTNPVFFLLTLNKNLLVTCLSYTYSIKKFPHVFTKWSVGKNHGLSTRLYLPISDKTRSANCHIYWYREYVILLNLLPMTTPYMLARVQTHEIMKLHNCLVWNPDYKQQMYISDARTNSTITYKLVIKTRKLSLLCRSNIFLADFEQAWVLFCILQKIDKTY